MHVLRPEGILWACSHGLIQRVCKPGIPHLPNLECALPPPDFYDPGYQNTGIKVTLKLVWSVNTFVFYFTVGGQS